MPAEPVLCSAPDCNHSFGSATGQALVALIELHSRTAHAPTTHATEPANTKAEKVRRPTITSQGNTEDWTYFHSRWQEYKAATKLTGADIIYQLLETCEESLRKDLHRTYGTLVGETEENVLKFINTLAIRPENVMVARVKLQNLRQDRDEPVRSFCARLRGQAAVCNYSKTKTCQCTQNVVVDYSDDMIRDSLIRGLEDDEIRLHILGQANQNMSLEETLQLAEAQECGKRSAGRLSQSTEIQNTTNAASSYRRRNNQTQQPNHSQPTHTQQQFNARNNQRLNQRNNRYNPPNATCSHCNEQGHGNGKSYFRRKKECPAFNHQCSRCNSLHHFEAVCQASQNQSHNAPHRNAAQNTAATANQDAVFEQFHNTGFFDAALSDRLCSADS